MFYQVNCTHFLFGGGCKCPQRENGLGWCMKPYEEDKGKECPQQVGTSKRWTEDGKRIETAPK